MGFKYHPPTRDYCSVCDQLAQNAAAPLIDSRLGKASSANNFAIHNWYHFVLGYTPQFPDYVLDTEKVSSAHLVMDPFLGSGTTLVCCKMRNIPSIGVDANDYFVDVARAKLNWSVDIKRLKEERNKILSSIANRYSEINFNILDENQPHLFSDDNLYDFREYAKSHRPQMLDMRYMSDVPFVKAHIIKAALEEEKADIDLYNLFKMSLSSILLPISNVRYGPGFGVGKPKGNVDVLKIFKDKIDRVIADLECVPEPIKRVQSEVFLGDSRCLTEYIARDSVDLMITSPPYPGDHEYSKHTRVELIFMGYASDLHDFRRIKKRMLRASTTNIYSSDNDAEYVSKFDSINQVCDLIDQRLRNDGATSGFEKLYTKAVREYFGGMYRALESAFQVLKENGKIYLLVSDSHAFKMVHIQTARILAELGKDIGFKRQVAELWQDKLSTSHKYSIKENILVLVK